MNNILKGTNYYMNRNPNGTINIIHRPTNSYVTLSNGVRVRILDGETFKKKGKGIGTNLRALATMYAILKGKNIGQTGSNREGRSVMRKGGLPIPTSTYILRHRLGWKPNVIKNSSIFRKGNNNTAVKKRVNNIKRN
jgi:hypothetical protein